MIPPQALAFIKKWEGLILKPYLCSGGKASIGHGSTYYEDDTPVSMSDPLITKDRAEELLAFHLGKLNIQLSKLITRKLTPNQLSALLSFAYNVGIGAFTNSTLLKMVNADPTDPWIKDEFPRWSKVKGRFNPGLFKRRKDEAALYFL